MPQLGDASDRLLHQGRKIGSSAGRFWSGFKDFALQDNVLEVAVGLMWVGFSFLLLWFWVLMV